MFVGFDFRFAVFGSVFVVKIRCWAVLIGGRRVYLVRLLDLALYAYHGL